MRCPFCSNEDTQVRDSRPTEDSSTIRRRRFCPACNSRFTTFERVQLRELTVIKASGNKVPFDRDKLARSLSIALRKRPIDDSRIDRIVNGIQRRLETLGANDVSTKTIGEMIMESLVSMDQVAYVRFASVYHDFHEAKDFSRFVGNLNVKNE